MSAQVFSFIKDANEREMLETAYNAINLVEGWDFLRKYCKRLNNNNGSFMFGPDSSKLTIVIDNFNELYKKPQELREIMSELCIDPQKLYEIRNNFDELYQNQQKLYEIVTKLHQIPEKVNEINGKINELYDGHSGSSYGWTMRQMEYIAINGIESYIVLRGF